MSDENPFLKIHQELMELNKDRELIKIIAENEKDKPIAKNLTRLLNKYIKENKGIWE